MVLRRLSVFAGGFTIEAAEAVVEATDDEREHGVQQSTFDSVASLVDKSLLNVESGTHEARYSMHETIREYGWEKVADAGELDTTRARHATHYLDLAIALSSLLDGHEVARSLEDLERELANIRIALEWALTLDDPGLALRIASALDSFWYYHGHLDEGRRYLKRALAMDGASDTERIDGMFTASVLAMLQADHAEVRSHFPVMRELSERIDYPIGVARAHLVFGASKEFQGFPDEAVRLFRIAEDLLEDLNSPRWTANLIMLRADAESQRDRLETAERLATEALAMASSIGHTWTEAHSHGVLAAIHLLRGRISEASRSLLEALDQYEAIGDIRGIAGTMAGAAAVAAATGAHDLSAQLLGGARETSDSIGVVYYSHYVHAQRTLSDARSVLEAAEFDNAFRLGRSFSTESHLANVRAVLHGQIPSAPDKIDQLANRYRFTRRETEVYRLLVQRKTNAQIAETCFMSSRTAEDHVAHIIGKLGVRSRWDAVAILDEL